MQILTTSNEKHTRRYAAYADVQDEGLTVTSKPRRGSRTGPRTRKIRSISAIRECGVTVAPTPLSFNVETVNVRKDGSEGAVNSNDFISTYYDEISDPERYEEILAALSASMLAEFEERETQRRATERPWDHTFDMQGSGDVQGG